VEKRDEVGAAGLNERTVERTLVIRSTPQSLVDRLAAVRDRVTVDQQVRLRVLRR